MEKENQAGLHTRHELVVVLRVGRQQRLNHHEVGRREMDRVKHAQNLAAQNVHHALRRDNRCPPPFAEGSPLFASRVDGGGLDK